MGYEGIIGYGYIDARWLTDALLTWRQDDDEGELEY
jgi:hypothetical protein